MNPINEFVAFTDGACRGNPGPGGWGVVLIQGSKKTEMSGSSQNTTNNRMEMIAAIEALSHVPINSKITLTTDSQYLKNGIQGWIKNWKRNGWRLKNGESVKNQDLWQKLDSLVSERKVQWEWVKGHNGNSLNERADYLATSAITKTKSGNVLKKIYDASTTSEHSQLFENKVKEIMAKNTIQTPGKKKIQDFSSSQMGYKTVSKDEFLSYHIPIENCDVYTDGACKGNPGPGGWGTVIQQNGFEFEMSGGERNTTNNRMELTAMIKAVSSLPKASVISLYTDSTYLKDGVTNWMKNWIKNGWKTSNNTEVKNQDLWRQIHELTKNYTISWNWVKGHDNHPQNERCDALAVAATPQKR